jgi:hypothetical protein
LLDCAECNRLIELLRVAVDDLVRANDRLSASLTGKNWADFDPLLMKAQAAKVTCERIRCEKDQHASKHGLANGISSKG